MTDVPQDGTQTPEQPAEGAQTPAPVEEVHGRIAEAAHRLVTTLEGIYEDTNLRGEVVAAKNELRDLLHRLEGDIQGTPAEAPAPGEGQ